MQRLRVHIARPGHEYEIKVAPGILRSIGREARRCLGPPARRVVIISNRRVFELYGNQTLDSFRASDFSVAYWLMGEGERFKSLRTLQTALNFLSNTGLERSDGVVALGGGVVGDLAGFAAAAYLRGVPLLQAPTTLLAQIDSSVGGKTGVNLPLGKNLVGAFHQPSAVVIDTGTLATLPRRELTSGWCESVKQGVVASRGLFEQTVDFLHKFNSNPEEAILSAQLEQLIAAQCAFKASVVSTDEREAIQRTDRRSRRILNFGHTVAHALETVTGYRRLRHGEAVGHGMLVAAQISTNLGLLGRSELELLMDAVRSCGPLPPVADLAERTIIDALALDKKSIGGRIQWVLLERIGKARIVDGKEIDAQLLRASLRATLRKR